MNFRIDKLAVVAAITISLTSLSGCFIYRADIQQGNEITEQMLSVLKTGMTKREVSRLLGYPLINDPFHKDRWDYYHSMKSGETGQTERQLTSLKFKDDLLSEISHSLD